MSVTAKNHIDLFSSIKLGVYTLPNRFVMAPLTRNRAGEGDAPTALNVTYYTQRASAGLIISEGSQISPQGKGYPGTPGIYSDKQINAWKAVTDAVHRKGSRIFLQLWHVGRISHPSLQPQGALPVAPSAIKPAGKTLTPDGMQEFVTPHALSVSEITQVIEDYRQAARNAMRAGFDGVEIHSANGYLLDQFLRDGTNQRADNYGGSLENRARLLLQVTQAVCEVWDAGRVGVRLSPANPFNDIHDSQPQKTFEYVVEQLNKFNLAYLHMVEGMLGNPNQEKPDVDFTRLRQVYKGIYMANGGYDKGRANAALASGHADLVSFGVAFLANPDLPTRFIKNATLNTPDRKTFYGGDATGYIDYPFLEQSRSEA